MTRPLTRRQIHLLLGASLLTACQTHADSFLDNPNAFDAGLPPSIGAGYIIQHKGKIIANEMRGYAGGLSGSETRKRLFKADTAMRVASVSKLVVLLLAHDLAREERLDLDADVIGLLDFPLRNPAYPNSAITTRHLLAHTSTLRDPEVYWMAAPGDIRELLTPAIYRQDTDQGPGDFFDYCNLNYGLVATILERVTQTRFDDLASDYLNGLGLDAGFNWSGVSLKKRQDGATLYRRDAEGRWQTQTDGPDVLNDNRPFYLGWDRDDLTDYIPGTNGTLFSPQGGLRASLEDLLILAQIIKARPGLHAVTWAYDSALKNGETADSHFLHYGDGLYVYPAEMSQISGKKMVGHHGEAYGLYSGLWVLPDHDIECVYAVTGSPEDILPSSGKTPDNRPYVQAFLDHIALQIKAL